MALVLVTAGADCNMGAMDPTGGDGTAGDGTPGDGTGGDGTPGDGKGEDLTVEQSLNRLGVATADTKRVDANGNDLPDSFSPLGSTLTLGPKELFTLGTQGSALHYGAQIYDDILPNKVPDRTFFGFGADWTRDTIHAVAAGDVDGDGLDEIFIVFADFDAPQDVYMEILNYNPDAPGDVVYMSFGNEVVARSMGRSLLLSQDGLTGLAVEAGDFDGDGTFEPVIGVWTRDSAQLLFPTNAGDGSFTVHDLNFEPFPFPGLLNTTTLRLRPFAGAYVLEPYPNPV